MQTLKSFLDLNGLRQAALARTLGISRAYMSELVKGVKFPGRDLAVKIERETGGAVPVCCWKHTAAHGAHAAPDQDAVSAKVNGGANG